MSASRIPRGNGNLQMRPPSEVNASSTLFPITSVGLHRQQNSESSHSLQRTYPHQLRAWSHGARDWDKACSDPLLFPPQTQYM